MFAVAGLRNFRNSCEFGEFSPRGDGEEAGPGGRLKEQTTANGGSGKTPPSVNTAGNAAGNKRNHPNQQGAAVTLENREMGKHLKCVQLSGREMAR